MPQTQTLNADRSRALPGRVARSSAQCAWLTRDEVIMGTAIHAQVWTDTPADGQAAVAAVMQEMHRIDQAMSHYKEASELSRINRDAARMAVPISDEMFRLIERAIEFSELSHGAFDITYAGVGHLFDYRQGTLPTDAQRDAARAAVGYRNLILDCAARTVRFARDGVRIDLGGFAKGHAVDNSIALLRQHGIEHAIVSAGGDSHVLGDRRGRPWTIAVRDPRRADRVVAVLPLEDTSISTSGDYERYFERDGVRHHHLIDPKTGSSPRALHSVTILAADGLTTEGLSKSVFVLGLEEGMRLVESLPGVDAIVVDAAGTLHFSSGLLDGRPQPRGDTRQ
jgi:thiamine biosynthesis lipoprotein